MQPIDDKDNNRNSNAIPRLLLTAASSGSGKTRITCGILKALKNRGLNCAAFKCGPDYIDPMFHRKVLGIDSYNLDTFMCKRTGVRQSLLSHGKNRDICVLEGVMGYYDGIAGISKEASAWDVADTTDTPAILILDCKGVSVSAVAVVKGFLEYETEHHIKGVILNRISPMMYARMKQMIEEQLKVRVYGYVPVVSECVLESRYLGLQIPEEVEKIDEKLEHLARVMEDTVDLDGVLELARNVSAIHDRSLPENIQGIVLYGGYPELYAKELSENDSMRESICHAVTLGVPCIAECGGFMYLQERMEGSDGKIYDMAGALLGKSYKTEKLRRFGYIILSKGTVFGHNVGNITAHEFHYYESEECGHAFTAKKPMSTRGWECMISTDTILAGYPHIHYMGNPQVAEAFAGACRRYKEKD